MKIKNFLKTKKHISVFLILFWLFIPQFFANEKAPVSFFNAFSNAEERMDNYTQSKLIQWNLNPFEHPYTDKFFNCWTDPASYNSYWYVYYPPKIEESYNKDKFNLDDVLFYHNPRIGTTVTPIAFSFNENTHRFYIGVGFLWDGYFMMYGHGTSKLYGTHLFLNSGLQVEPFIDYIYKDKLRIRLSPIRHICWHMAGDILGDNTLHNLDRNNTGEGDHFKDVGFEQVHASINYRWGWFNFYGGAAAAVTSLSQSSYVNLAYFYGGAEMKLPIYGQIHLIAGIHIGGNYDKINSITHIIEGNKYSCTDTRYELTPVISAGIGIGINDWVMGLKFDYAQSKQIYALGHMEARIGFSAYRFLD